MKKIEIQVADYVYEYYRKIGESAGGLAPEKVMSDALFRLAGALSLHAMKETTKEQLSRGVMEGL